MTVSELIDKLNELKNEVGGDAPIRFDFINFQHLYYDEPDIRCDRVNINEEETVPYVTIGDNW